MSGASGTRVVRKGAGVSDSTATYGQLGAEAALLCEVGNLLTSESYTEARQKVAVQGGFVEDVAHQVRLKLMEVSLYSQAKNYTAALSTLNEVKLLDADAARHYDVVEQTLQLQLNVQNGQSVGAQNKTGTGNVSAQGKTNGVQTGQSSLLIQGQAPKEFGLSQNYPNPFNPTTVIKYAVPSAAKVSVRIYDMLGRVVSELVNETKAAGYYEARFDASRLSSGVYFYKLQAGNFVETKKMLLVK